MTIEKTAKKASKLRKDFRIKFKKVATKFNEVCLEMDQMLSEIAGEDDENN